MVAKLHMPEINSEPQGWFKTPTAFVERDLKFADGSTVKVYMALLCHANEDREAWPSVRRIAMQTGLSERQVHRSLRWIENRHWIKGFRQYGHATRYRIWIGNHHKRHDAQDTTRTEDDTGVRMTPKSDIT